MLNSIPFILNILTSLRTYIAEQILDDMDDNDKKFLDTMLLSVDKSITTLKREINRIKLDSNKKQD